MIDDDGFFATGLFAAAFLAAGFLAAGFVLAGLVVFFLHENSPLYRLGKGF
jgi:hypothetical protein